MFLTKCLEDNIERPKFGMTTILIGRVKMLNDMNVEVGRLNWQGNFYVSLCYISINASMMSLMFSLAKKKNIILLDIIIGKTMYSFVITTQNICI